MKHSKYKLRVNNTLLLIKQYQNIYYNGFHYLDIKNTLNGLIWNLDLDLQTELIGTIRYKYIYFLYLSYKIY